MSYTSPRPARLRAWTWRAIVFWPTWAGLVGAVRLGFLPDRYARWGVFVFAAGMAMNYPWASWLGRFGREDRVIAWLRLDPHDV